MVAKDARPGRGQLKKQSLMRARRSSSDDDEVDDRLHTVPPQETFHGPMSNVKDWDVEERQISRRLVHVTRIPLRLCCAGLRVWRR